MKRTTKKPTYPQALLVRTLASLLFLQPLTGLFGLSACSPSFATMISLVSLSTSFSASPLALASSSWNSQTIFFNFSTCRSSSLPLGQKNKGVSGSRRSMCFNSVSRAPASRSGHSSS
ncbi:hypothetical protein FN846DRAFT_966138 [Sphaerosporella brunnea]|uniref:Uncharacterized protein n=1 Tax=Sphaerosporella brunnea TaxID=1250544 RepID=A0A5J5ELT5_9PEZI|nr:hypothetical protein FN846DRAFT_966138 [Sphaerosporella brunnea]